MGVEMWNGPKIAKHTGFDPERRYKEERALLEVVGGPQPAGLGARHAQVTGPRWRTPCTVSFVLSQPSG